MRLKNISHSVNDLYWFLLPLILPGLLDRFDLSYGRAGGILTLFLFVAGIGSFFSGKLSDTMGRREIISYGFILSAAGFTVSAFAGSIGIFMLIIGITALGVSTFHPVMYALIDETFTVGKGKILGVYEAFGTGAILLMYIVNGFLLAKIGIRGILIVTAIPAYIMGVIYLKSKRIPSPFRENEQSGNKSTETGQKATLVLFIVAIILRVFSVTAVMNFLPVYFVRYLDFSQSSAVYFSSLFFAGGIAGSIFIGKLADSMDSVVLLVFCSVIIAVSVILLSFKLPYSLYPLLVISFGMAGSGAFVNQNLLMSHLGSHLGKGESFGILMAVITGTGAVSPFIFGTILDRTGFSYALILISLPVIAGIPVLEVVRRKMKILV